MASSKDKAQQAGFGGAEDGALAPKSVGAAQMMGREAAGIQAALVVAAQFPRNEADAYAKLHQSCTRPSFAEDARYVFPRGGKEISGPSVYFAKEAARCWKHVRFGFYVTERTEATTIGEGWAWDLEANNFNSAGFAFQNLIQRKVGEGRNRRTEWIVPDERDYRELLNKNGAIAIRNAILSILPPDMVDDAIRQVKETLDKAAKGEIEQDRPATLRRLAVAFRDYGVTGTMIEARIGHSLDLMTEQELVELRGIYKSIQDGVGRREEFFPVDGAEPAAAQPPKAANGKPTLDTLAGQQPPQPTAPQQPQAPPPPAPTPPPAQPPPSPPASQAQEKPAAAPAPSPATKQKEGAEPAVSIESLFT